MSKNVKKPTTSTKKKEPIAIVGMGCRFPGNASSPFKLWELLITKKNSIRTVPKERWDERRFYSSNSSKPGKMHARKGGFLSENLQLFNPEFFNISHREAAQIDPQQRLLMETSWEALENAGIIPETLSNSNTGVYIGCFGQDTFQLLGSPYYRMKVDMHTATACTKTILPARLSYFYNFKGPCLSIDTACSSSLVAIHYACQDLWNKECSTALAGGVNYVYSPEFSIMMCKGGYLSADSLCRAFDAKASGYVRGEGAGVLVLKPLSSAIKENLPIYAVIKATGTNQDGNSESLPIPNKESQKTLIQKVQKEANILPHEIQYVEAHGTGTKVGDPAEAWSLNETLKTKRDPKKPCLIGSIKTNIGHLEGAAGVAGVIKTALSLYNKKIPPNLHFNTPNPEIPFDSYCIKVPTELSDFAFPKKPLYAAVNSFGFGGSNAHLILGEAPKRDSLIPLKEKKKQQFFIPFSAKTLPALKETAKQYLSFLQEPLTSKHPNPLSLQNLFYNRIHKQTHHPYRMMPSATNLDELATELSSFVENEHSITHKKALREKNPPLAFVFTGMGPQWWKMGRELLEKDPLFKHTIKRCDKILKSLVNWSLIKELKQTKENSRLLSTEIAQPANLALQIGLIDVLKEKGIIPDAVVGHSIGEVSAAYAANILSLEDALFISIHRSRLQATKKGTGTLLAVGESLANLKELLQDFGSSISIAAINAPSATTLAGSKLELEKIANKLKEKEIFFQFLKVEIPYHSSYMDELKEDFLNSIQSIKHKKASIEVPFYSTVTGEKQKSKLSCSYWWKNLRQTVQFSKAIQTMIQDGYALFLEVGPHPVLASSIKEILYYKGEVGHTLSTLNRKKEDLTSLNDTISQLYTAGYAIDWEALAPTVGAPLFLPSYPWQKKLHWKDESFESAQYLFSNPNHVMLSQRVNTHQPTWQVEFNRYFFEYVEDHSINNKKLFPGASFIEAGLAIHKELFNKTECTLEDLTFHHLLELKKGEEHLLQFSYDLQTHQFKVHSRLQNNNHIWTLHASGKIYENPLERAPLFPERKEFQKSFPSIDGKEIIEHFKKRNCNYGPYFQNVSNIWFNEKEVLAEIVEPKTFSNNDSSYLLHPSYLDSSMRVVLKAINDKLGSQEAMVPVKVKQIDFYKQPKKKLWCYGFLTEKSMNHYCIDVILFDEIGETYAYVKGIQCQALREGAAKKEALDNLLYSFEWQQEGAPLFINNKKATSSLAGKKSSNFQDMQESELISKLYNKQWLFFSDNSESNSYKKACQFLNEITESFSSFDVEEVINKKDLKELIRSQLHSTIKNKPLNVVLFFNGKVKVEEFSPQKEIDTCLFVLELIQELLKENDSTKLFIITNGAQKEQLFHSSLWGLGRGLMSENTKIKTFLIDLDPEDIIPEKKLLPYLVNEENKEEELSFEDSSLYIHRLKNTRLYEDPLESKTKIVSTEKNNIGLTIKQVGKPESLAHQILPKKAPKNTEIEIQNYFTRVYFKDLLKLTGMLSLKRDDLPFINYIFGNELSGKITRIGEAVSDYKVGDEVCAFSPNSYQSFITIEQKYVMPIPPGSTMEEAPLYLPFVTALRALQDLAQLKKGEKVLIHSASGCVGFAAIQYAKYIGAEVYATTRLETKKLPLKALGASLVGRSDSLEFAAEVLEWTNEKGVDVILNSLSKEGLQKSWSLLAPYGRFIEIGKLDILNNHSLPMLPFDKNAQFASVDIEHMFFYNYPLAKRLIQDVFAFFKKGIFSPIQTTTFSLKKPLEAFNYLSSSNEISKVVISFKNEKIKLPVQKKLKSPINKDGTYLITGGFSGLGKETAQWLINNGAKNIALVSRTGKAGKGEEIERGKATEIEVEVEDFTKEWKKQGINILCSVVDITEKKAVEAFLKKIKKEMPPLKGIIHSAMVLKDSPIEDISKKDFLAVLKPKIMGAWNLHTCSLKENLDFFITYSSIVSLMGNVGQASYAAANAFLDSLSLYRSSQDLPSTTINWGPIADLGTLFFDVKTKNFLSSIGFTPLSTPEVHATLLHTIKSEEAQICATNIDWDLWSEKNAKRASSPSFSKLITTMQKQQFLIDIAKLEKTQKIAHTCQKLIEILESLLKLPKNEIHPETELPHLGIDSLMLVEFKNILYSTFGFEVSRMEIQRGSTIKKLGCLLLKRAGFL